MRAAAGPRRAAAAADPAALDAALLALADPTRRAVVELLHTRPHRAGEIAEALGVSASALSRHLRQLRRSGLVTDDEPEEDARVRLYRLQPEGFASLQDWVAAIGSLWQVQLASFKAHAEAAAGAPARPARRRSR